MSVSPTRESLESPSRRQSAAERSREATRERLLSSGVALFAERGLNGVTTHDIARGAGVAAGTFYLHFSDKQSLFAEIAQDTERRLLEHIEDAADDTADMRGAVRAQVEALIDFSSENRDLIRILFSAESGVVGSALLDSLARFIAEGRRHAISTGEMPREIDAAVLSQALVGLLSRVVLWWLEDEGGPDRETVIETLTHIQLSGTHPARAGATLAHDTGSPLFNR
jgi:AcrR family transcriptional regulator